MVNKIKLFLLIIFVLLIGGCDYKSFNGLIGSWHGIMNSKDKYLFNDDNSCFFAGKPCIFIDDLTRVTIIFEDSFEANTYEYEIIGDKLVMVDVLGNVKYLIGK